MSADVMLREAPPAPTLATIPESRIVTERRFVTLDEYFEIAEWSENLVEYIDGEMFPMSSVTLSHGVIQTNLTLALGNLHHEGYTLLPGANTVSPDPDAYVHPDLTVVRGVGQFARNNLDLLNPVAVIEVFSKSTRRHDMVRKLPRYRAMPSLEHIVYIEQERASVTHHARVDGRWTRREYTDLDDVVPLESLGASLSLAQVYRGVIS